MRDSYRHFASEFIGTFFLVFIGGGAIMMAPEGGAGLIAIAIAHGFALAIGVTALMRISGHFNPAVTFGFLVTRRIEPMMAGLYIVAQILGAMAASYALKGLIPAAMFALAHGGIQSISIDISGTQAFFLEAIATFMLVFVVFATAVDPQAPKVGGFAIGLVVMVGILAIGPLTGGSMNPARSFGPAVAVGMYEGQIIYWLGPIFGGIVAAAMYEGLFLRRAPEPVDHGVVQPDTPEPRGRKSRG